MRRGWVRCRPWPLRRVAFPFPSSPSVPPFLLARVRLTVPACPVPNRALKLKKNQNLFSKGEEPQGRHRGDFGAHPLAKAALGAGRTSDPAAAAAAVQGANGPRVACVGRLQARRKAGRDQDSARGLSGHTISSLCLPPLLFTCTW